MSSVEAVTIADWLSHHKMKSSPRGEIPPFASITLSGSTKKNDVKQLVSDNMMVSEHAMNSDSHVLYALTDWRADFQAIGIPLKYIIDPDVLRRVLIQFANEASLKILTRGISLPSGRSLEYILLKSASF